MVTFVGLIGGLARTSLPPLHQGIWVGDLVMNNWALLCYDYTQQVHENARNITVRI
jgi:hypothetical protein